MESLIRAWDGESMIIRFDRIADAFIIIAVHSTRLGPAIGGTRMKQYSDLDSAVKDAQRLAGGMTYKWAASGLDAGGGKAVISLPSDLDPKMRDELLLGEIFYSLKEAQVLVEMWRKHYNTVRPHSSLG